MTRIRLDIEDAQLCVGCQVCMFACSRRHGSVGPSDSRILVRSIGGMQNGFSIIVCRACPDPPCATACPESALVTKKDKGVTLIRDRCTGCGYCRDACTLGSVFWDHINNIPIICDQCGYCARYCPHGVLLFDAGSGQ